MSEPLNHYIVIGVHCMPSHHAIGYHGYRGVVTSKPCNTIKPSNEGYSTDESNRVIDVDTYLDGKLTLTDVSWDKGMTEALLTHLLALHKDYPDDRIHVILHDEDYWIKVERDWMPLGS